jgi:hypothetical protein
VQSGVVTSKVAGDAAVELYPRALVTA